MSGFNSKWSKNISYLTFTNSELYFIIMERKKNFIHISELVDNIVSQYQKSNDGVMMKIIDIWEDAVGEFISEQAKPVVFKEKILIVHVNNSSLIQTLHFLKKKII